MRAYHLAYRRRRRDSHVRRVGLLVLFLAALAVLTGGAGVAVMGAYYVNTTSDLTSPDVLMARQGGGARILDRNGNLLYQFVDDNLGYQDLVTLDQISPDVAHATVATEDASFYSNPGINPTGLLRAVGENLKPGQFMQGSGGSSITQQVVKQLYETPQQRSERSISRKLKEMAIAIALTRKYSKDQILTWYLNTVPYGNNFTGIEAAAEGYFSKHASELDLAQAAFLAGLPQSPAQYDPFTNPDAAKSRQIEVLNLMAEHGYISQYAADVTKMEPITLNPQAHPFLAPHFVAYVADQIRQTLGQDALDHGGLTVTTTLDLNLQNEATADLEKWVSRYEDSTNAHNGAVVITDPNNGQILTMVGSRDYFRQDIQGQNNNATTLKSPGSSFKPFTYLTAFEQGWGPDWPMVDSPITYKETDGSTFSPDNPDHAYHGVIKLRQAFGSSLNVPAFKTALWVGVPNIVATARKMGITTLNGQYGPSITLGSGDVTVLDMAYAYGVFATEGVMAGQTRTGDTSNGMRQLDPVSILVVKDRLGHTLIDNTGPPKQVRVIDPAYAYMMTSILMDDSNRQLIFGAGSVLDVPDRQIAAKSGTSAPFPGQPNLVGDTWTLGYSPDRVVAVWVGNADNAPMRNIFSTTIAGAAWHDIIVAAHKDLPKHDFVVPPGIVTATVCVPSGMAPTPTCGRTVTGQFVEASLNKQPDTWWSSRGFNPPPDVTGYKRQLAYELAGMSIGGPARRPTPTATASAAPAVPFPAAPTPRRPAAQPPTGPPGQGNKPKH